MYVPSHFAETRPEVLHEVLRRYPLATLITAGSGGLMANHLPLLFDEAAGQIRGHLSRANPQWREFGDGLDGLAVFHGPQHYISPSWYPSKAEHGRVVPTWNFVAVHVYGRVQIFESLEKLVAHVTEMTHRQESGYPAPWKVADAPAEYVASLAKGIVGIEMAVHRMEGKFKLSQNRVEADRHGVADALADEPVAQLMRQLGVV